MRPFQIALMLCVACAASKPARVGSPVAADDELLGACVPERPEPEPRHCVLEDDGTWKTSTPPTNVLIQGRTLLNEGMPKPAVVTLTHALKVEDACGRQFARWLRAEASFELGDARAAFLDYASVIRDGPEHPFYKEVWPRIEALKPHIPEQAYITCAAVYVAPEATPTGRDPHWVPYGSGEKP